MIRRAGALTRLAEDRPALTEADIARLIRMLTTPEQWACFESSGDLDFCYSFPTAAGTAPTSSAKGTAWASSAA